MGTRLKPKKILMTAGTLGGVWTFAVDLCSYLNEHNIHVALALMGPPLSDMQRGQLFGLKNVTLLESTYKLEWMQEPWRDFENSLKWLAKINRDYKPDVIHLNTFSHGALNWQAPVIITFHSDVFSRWKAIKKEEPPSLWKEYYRRVSGGLKNADIISFPSFSMLKMFNKHYGSFYNTRVIYNGRQIQHFSSNNEKKPAIISTGSLADEAKNIRLLVKAAKGIKWKICIAGDEHHPQSSHKDLDVSHVNFLGRLTPSALSAQFSEASIYVLPAIYEPFGLPALEAAMSGCALVLGNIESLREIWQDNAIYVDTNDEEELKIKVNQLINDKKLLKEYSEKALKHARFFTHTYMGSQYLESYNSIIATRLTKQIENNNVLSLSSATPESHKRSLTSRISNRVITSHRKY